MSEKPIFTDVLQVAVVVKNLDESMKKYWEVCGIGPWIVYGFNPTTVSYFDTQDSLSTIAEIYNTPSDFQWPPADATYP